MRAPRSPLGGRRIHDGAASGSKPHGAKGATGHDGASGTTLADERPQLTDLIELQELQRLQDAFALATGVASLITAPDGRPITAPSQFSKLCRDVIRATPKGLENCIRSDAELGRPNPSGPIVRPCLSSGLWDGGASIFAGPFHVGNWLIGQVRNEAQDTEIMAAYAADIGSDVGQFRSALAEVPLMSIERFRHVCEFLFVMANHISALAYAHLCRERDLEKERTSAREKGLREAQARQREKMEAVGRLAGGVAHDFNNLLTVIHGNVALLKALPVEPTHASQAFGMLDEIAEAASRATELTRKLLAFGRQGVVAPVPLDVSRVLSDFQPILRRLLTEHIELDVRCEERPSVARIDPIQLEQVILNLLVNARDAMPDGGVVEVTTERVMVDELYSASHAGLSVGPYVTLSVRDTGVGMTPEVTKQVFDPFFTTKGVGQGTGLGLATVYGIVQQAGGQVTVYSEVGRGSTFRVYLPLSSSAPASLLPESNSPAVGGAESVLLCEDAHGVRVLTARILREAGYTVYATSNAEEALALDEQQKAPVRLLITDVLLPGLSGPKLAQAITARRPGLRVLFVSGYTGNLGAHQGVLPTGVELLQKPYTRESLLKKVRAVIDG